jgi:hypothetical protein
MHCVFKDMGGGGVTEVDLDLIPEEIAGASNIDKFLVD